MVELDDSYLQEHYQRPEPIDLGKLERIMVDNGATVSEDHRRILEHVNGGLAYLIPEHLVPRRRAVMVMGIAEELEMSMRDVATISGVLESYGI